ISDTIACDSVSRSISFTRTGCPLPTITDWSIVGRDSENFKVSHLDYDSVEVTLYCKSHGDQEAQLILTYDGGQNVIITLAGFVSGTLTPLSLVHNKIKTDTIGQTVSVPITINGLDHPEDVELVLHYD